MLGVRFPAAFMHSIGGVSEINVSCDVYSDSFGLQYWIGFIQKIGATAREAIPTKSLYGPSQEVARQPTEQR
jgi:hypothetical protein